MIFRYRAVNEEGNVIEKSIEASSVETVIQYLRKNNYTPLSVVAKKDKQSNLLSLFMSNVSFNDIVDFTRQLAIMLNAGLTIVESLSILKKQATKPKIQKMIDDIDKEIKSGNPFSSALKKYFRYFSNLYIALVKSGEASGKLGEILLRLADNLEKEREFKSKLKGALTYPVVIVIGMLVVMFIMITFVIPRLFDLYKDFNISLPLTTQLLIVISDFMVKFWPVLAISLVCGGYLLKKYFESKAGKKLLDGTLLKLPFFGKIISISSLVNSTRTLAILVGAGVSILESLAIVIETTDNLIFKEAFINVYHKVEKGQSIGSSLEQEGVFPPILVQMTVVGEQTGNLDDTLLRLSKYFETESEIAIKSMTTLIEPLILVILGLGVGFLVMSVITPIYNLTTSFK
ncbi:MAG: type II secretion system F family protein [Patescibacteria group bacterium]|nr:type II secretion system F family protein [Patescibacteria group bacterium]